MAKVLVPIAEGSEELEAITVIDLLRRANIDVTVASLDGKPVTCSRKTTIVPDCGLADATVQDFDMVVLPGGLPGADHLDNDERLRTLLQQMHADGKFVTAICAAPKVLAHAGVLTGKKATSYPGFLDNTGVDGVASTGGAVERDGNVITSRGPGTAMDFALVLIEALEGAGTRDEVEARLVRA
jgi:4-methyl-5(b-hydroxyethyl)-thiazole monophosphate biosynthesis